MTTNSTINPPLWEAFSPDNPLIKRYGWKKTYQRRYLFGYYLPDAYTSMIADRAEKIPDPQNEEEENVGLQCVIDHLIKMSKRIGAGDKPSLHYAMCGDEISDIVYFYTSRRLPKELPTEELLRRWKEALFADGCTPRLGWFAEP